MKTLYYYQTFVGLHKLFPHLTDIDVITVSSIHFDESKDGVKNIYLNDNLPSDPKFDDMWCEGELVSAQGVTIMLMVGGEGGAYTNLFKEFETYYPMLRSLLQSKSFIRGIDLDVEESVNLSDIQMLIRTLKRDFPNLLLSMAPIAESLVSDGPGMGGFSYKTLLNTKEGSEIDWLNAQCYDSFSCETVSRIVSNGYDPSKIVMGMLSGQFTTDTFPNALKEVQQILTKYPTFGGVFDWEYLDAPPDSQDPSQWCKLMKDAKESLWIKGGDIILE